LIVTDDVVWPRFGAFSYGFETVDSLVHRFKAMGLTAVQWGGALLDESIANPDRVESTRGFLSDAGIDVVGLAGYRNPVAPDEAVRHRNLRHLERCLEIAPALGIPVVATETGTLNAEDWKASPENRTPAALEMLYASLEELLPTAEHYGSIIALEAYVNNVIRTEEDVAQLLERYPTAALQLVLDPFNFISLDLLPNAEAVSSRLLKRFRERWAIAHLKDVSAEGAEVDTPAFGDGVFPMAHFKKFLREERPDMPIILEHIDLDRIPKAIERFHAIR
jgi:sugar phosphate isomerase/epimerase